MNSSHRIRAGLTCALLILATSGCAASADGEAAEGRVVDANTGEPIAGVWVFEAVPAERLAADVRRFGRVREQQTDEDGRFRFEPVGRGFLERLFSEPKPPRYHVYHESYGFVWGRAEAGRIEISLFNSNPQYQDALLFCTSKEEDLLRERVRSLHCPPARPELFADGSPRTRGAHDARGDRTGVWRFYREDGSVIAEGWFVGGAATGNWVYRPKPASADSREID
ncbi:MAG: hypothetical protein ACPGVZ_13875 [Myxococcota bacterium]